MKEPWVIFKDKTTGKELCAYTVRGTFSGELESTKEMLAYENGIDTDQISVEVKRR